MLLGLRLFIIFGSFLLVPCDDVTDNRIKQKLLKLNTELVKDAIGKINAVQHFREEFHRSTPYQIGEITCTVHNLLNKMLKIYKSLQRGISLDVMVQKLNLCHRYFFEADHTIRMIELWEKKKSDHAETYFNYLKANSVAGRRYQELASGTELERHLEAKAYLEGLTTTPPLLNGTKRKNKPLRWHPGR